MYVTAQVLAQAEAAYGRPLERLARYEIYPAEMAMIRASQRDGRAHDVTVAAMYGDQVAVIAKHSYPPGAYRIPGGALRPGEPMAEGAARELLEETGLSCTISCYLLRVSVTFAVAADTLDWTTHFMLATADSTVLSPRDLREIREARWSSFAELNGSIGEVLRATGRPLFAYRTDLHQWAAEALT